MNKREKETAAIYISSCVYDYFESSIESERKRAQEDMKKYLENIKTMLVMKFELFGLDYEKTVNAPIREIGRIAEVFYHQRLNGEQLKYPA